MCYRESPIAKPREAPILELKAIPPHLRYLFLSRDDTLIVIIATDLNGTQVEFLVAVLKRLKYLLVRLLMTLF